MKPNDSRGSGRRGRGPRRSNRSRSDSRAPQVPQTPQKKTFWQKLVAFFAPTRRPGKPSAPQGRTDGSKPASRGKDYQYEPVAVTSARLYIGNLSYDATESDLQELFNGVGAVRSAEIVTHKQTERSKGFGFVTMSTIDEAKRAVVELHDKEFMGRKLVINGAKTSDREPNYRG